MTFTEIPPVERLVCIVREAMNCGDMPMIERIVLAYRGTPYEAALLEHPELEALLPALREQYCIYETNDEWALRAGLIATPEKGFGGSTPIARTFAYVPLEAVAAGIEDGARYCHVGSGPLPETLLALRNFVGRAQLTGVDQSAEAIQLSREFVQVFAPRSAISFLHAAGDDLDYRGFTHIHVAALVRPEYGTVQSICDTADDNVVLLLRTVSGLGSLVYQPLAAETESLLEARGFKRAATVRGHAIMQTAIYRR